MLVDQRILLSSCAGLGQTVVFVVFSLYGSISHSGVVFFFWGVHLEPQILFVFIPSKSTLRDFSRLTPCEVLTIHSLGQ